MRLRLRRSAQKSDKKIWSGQWWYQRSAYLGKLATDLKEIQPLSRLAFTRPPSREPFASTLESRQWRGFVYSCNGGGCRCTKQFESFTCCRCLLKRERVRLTFAAISGPDYHSYMICLFRKVPKNSIVEESENLKGHLATFHYVWFLLWKWRDLDGIWLLINTFCFMALDASSFSTNKIGYSC